MAVSELTTNAVSISHKNPRQKYSRANKCYVVYLCLLELTMLYIFFFHQRRANVYFPQLLLLQVSELLRDWCHGQLPSRPTLQLTFPRKEEGMIRESLSHIVCEFRDLALRNL